MFNKKGKLIKTISLMVLGSMFMAMNTNTAYAVVDSLVVQDGVTKVNYEYNLSQLIESQKQFYRGGSAVLFEDFDKVLKIQGNKIVSYHDTVNLYVSSNSIMQAYTQAQRNEEAFNLDSFTQSIKAEKVSINTSKKSEKSGKIVLDETAAIELEVISIE
jgi:hypothetical protein